MPNTSHKNESALCKSRKNSGINSTPEERKNRNDLLLAQILSGDLIVVKRMFFWMIGKRYFRVMKQRLTSDQLNFWVNDLSQEVFFAVYSKIVRGKKIEFVKSFIFKIILFQTLDEDKRIGRTEPIDGYVYKDPSFERRPTNVYDKY